ncbi:hypothetical protein DYH09_00740 [bacterium CPR1]|nr:hypothetical protein [bacterium CPR1]
MSLDPVSLLGTPLAGRLRVDASGHPLPGESVQGITPDVICQALRQGDADQAAELTRILQQAARSGQWTVEEPGGQIYPLEVSAGKGSDLMHLLRNGVVMKLALEARKNPDLKARLSSYEQVVTGLNAPLTQADPRAPLLAEECERVMLGMADPATSERVRGALLHRLDVQERTLRPLSEGQREIRAKLEGNAGLVEILADLQVNHPEFIGQHMIFRNALSLSHWLGIPMTEQLEPADRAVVVGGLHGNERSGTAAAEQIAQEQDQRVQVFPRANPWAHEHCARNGPGEVDMNRVFPGDPYGTPEEQQAHVIFQAASKADVVIDLHEALHDWRDGRAGRLCLFQPTPRTLAFLHRMQDFLDQHDFRLVPFRYPGTLVQEVARAGNTVGLLFEVPLTLDFEARTQLATGLTRAALDVAFQPQREP